ncbi:MAG: hypothetical protein M3296_04420 [Actinomycetota bacterium]|nr:hypothetical protein [Actinomycetota bacterium]
MAAGTLIALPGFSSGATVKPKLRSFAPVQVRQAQAPNPRTQPPLHGTNPHGQGTAAVVDLNPSATRPFSADPTGRTDNEDIVVGRSRGEQRSDGTYHGHITVAALFGNEIIAGADTAPGQTVDTGIAQNLLDQLCTGTGICLSAVRVQSATTTAGSLNRFSLASAALGGPPGNLQASLRIGAAESQGNILSDPNCQASHGGSQVANITSGGVVTAAVATSGSDSRACRGQAPTQTNTSRVVQLGEAGLPIPAAGCDNGTPDVETGLPGLLPIVCNADDSSNSGGTQATAPYGVRDALDVYVLAVGPTALAKVSASSSESLAVAPPAPPTPPTPPKEGGKKPGENKANKPEKENAGAGNQGAGNRGAGNRGAGNRAAQCSDGVDNDGDGLIDFGRDPGCSSRSDNSEANGAANATGRKLPFTGTDVVGLGLAGSLLLAAGLALRGPTRRRELGR